MLARTPATVPRGMRTGVLVLTLMLLTPSAALAADGGLRVNINGGPGFRFSAREVDDALDVPRNTKVTIRAPEMLDERGGTSIEKALALAGVSAAHVTKAEIERPNGTGVVAIDPDEIVNGFDGDPLGLRYATFDGAYNNHTEVHFFRPLRSTPGDANRNDELEPPTGTDLVMRVSLDGPPLSVSASARPTPVDRGAPVSFSASVAGGSGTPTFTWDFDDSGDSGRGADVVHAFAQNGVYDATVTATTPDGGSGVKVVRVQVGSGSPDAPGGGSGPTGPSTGAGGGTGNAKAPAVGPRRGALRGGRGGARRGGRGGAQHGGRARTRGRGREEAGRAEGGRAEVKEPGSHAFAPTGDGAASAPPGTPSDESSSGDRAAAASGHSGAPEQRRRRQPAPSEPAREVTGILLASNGVGVRAAVRQALAGQGPAATAASRAAAAASDPIAWNAVIGIGLALLVALGAARELGLPRRGRRGAS
jgi:PKD repeat protein